jgi:methylsterol monooxygenase
MSAMLVLTPPHATWAWLMSSITADYQKVVLVMTSVFVVVYWTNGLLLLALEHLCSKLLHKYRIQKQLKSWSRPSNAKLFRNIAVNTCVVPVIGLVMGHMIKFRPSDFEIPGPFEMFLSTLAGVLVNEITFFYGHWLFHANKFLYRQVHKIHHEFKAPCALAAVYCHPIELVLSDFIPLSAGIILFNANLYNAAVFTTFAVLGTQTHHCGFRWPWIPSHGNQPDFHDMHHERNHCNYGNIGFMDALHGTSFDGKRPVSDMGKKEDKKINDVQSALNSSPGKSPTEASSVDGGEVAVTGTPKQRSTTPTPRIIRGTAA